jgi:hypothetical protein
MIVVHEHQVAMVWVIDCESYCVLVWWNIKVDQSPNLGGARFTMTWPAKRFNQKLKQKNLSKQKKSTISAFFFLI